MSGEISGRFYSFDCESEPIPPGTPATPRPADRPRESGDAVFTPPAFYSFDCESEPIPPGTPATPRPADRPRELDSAITPTAADADFAREMAANILEYVRSRSAGMSAEQLAALIQQFLARRSA